MKDTFIEIKVTKENDIITYKFSGELDQTNTDKTFTNIYEEIKDFKDKKILFDFEKLTYICNKGLGYLIDINGNLEEEDSKFAIANSIQNIEDVLDIVGLTEIIPCFDNTVEALDYLKQSTDISNITGW